MHNLQQFLGIARQAKDHFTRNRLCYLPGSVFINTLDVAIGLGNHEAVGLFESRLHA